MYLLRKKEILINSIMMVEVGVGIETLGKRWK